MSIGGHEITDGVWAEKRAAVYRDGTPADQAEQAWADLVEIAEAPLTTNDPYIAVALQSVAAELRAARHERAASSHSRTGNGDV